MNLNLDDIFGSAKAAISQQLDDLGSVGKPALVGYLEDQALKIISADKNQNQATFEANLNTVINRPTAAGSFGDYVSGLAQSPIIKSYGPYILLAAGAGLCIALLLKK